jgi:hypothetical protein
MKETVFWDVTPCSLVVLPSLFLPEAVGSIHLQIYRNIRCHIPQYSNEAFPRRGRERNRLVNSVSLNLRLGYATSRKVAGSIPDEVSGYFNLLNTSSRTMALGSTQPLTERSTRNLSGGKGRSAGEWGWQPLRHLWADCLENVGASTSHKLIDLHSLLQG